MSSWGNKDSAANAPLWAVNSAIAPNNPTHARGTRANVTLLYANTTAGAYTTGETIGLFGIDAQEQAVSESTYDVPHSGWVIRTTGSGGRAGRVQHEVLVALSSVYGDGDGQLYPNVAITLVGPSNKSVLSSATFANVASFSVTPTLKGNTSATLTYTWQYNNASGSQGWIAVANNDVSNVHTTGMTSTTLSIAPKTTANNAQVFRLVVTAADEGVTAYSANATLTVS